MVKTWCLYKTLLFSIYKNNWNKWDAMSESTQYLLMVSLVGIKKGRILELHDKGQWGLLKKGKK